MKLHEEADLPVWRSMLFVPANIRKYVEKASSRGADAVILDLEDSITPADKEAARGMVAEAARICGQHGADILVRINRPLELAVRDLEEVISPVIKGVLLPKVDSASHIRLLAEVADTVEARRGMTRGHTKFLAMVETAEAFARIPEIAIAHPRNVALSLGGEDFALSTGSAPDPDVLLYPKQQIVIAARAAGILPMGVIGTIADYKDVEGYREIIRRSRRFGFVCSSCIHPSIVPLLNEGFSPSAEEVASAKRVIAAFERAAADNRGSIEVDGKMIDIPIVDRAQRLVDRAQRLARLADARPRGL
jgi:citrate lyase subunit beta/citryl-CoA lyase